VIVALLVAAAENGVIGRDGDLPWRLPRDLQWFKRLTTGHTLIMGRKTFESIGKPLPDRRTIVVTRNPSYHAPGVEIVGSLDEAFAIAADETEVFVVGGAAIYREALPRATRLYVTRVHADVDGDVTFPPLNPAEWRLVWEEPHPADERHAYAVTFQQLDRVRPGPRERMVP